MNAINFKKELTINSVNDFNKNLKFMRYLLVDDEFNDDYNKAYNQIYNYIYSYIKKILMDLTINKKNINKLICFCEDDLGLEKYSFGDIICLVTGELVQSYIETIKYNSKFMELNKKIY